MPPTPKHIEVIARALIRQADQVLLCQNKKKAYYYLPGGHVEPGETAANALARELKEETGQSLPIGPPLFACEVLFHDGLCAKHEYNILFHVEHSTPAIRSLEPGIAFVWADQAAVADLDIRPAVIRAWLAAGGLSRTSIGWESADVNNRQG